MACFIVFLAVPAFAGKEQDAYIHENRMLAEELALARKPDLYFVFNLKEKLVSINARGIHLKELRLASFHSWGRPLVDGTYQLTRKTTFFKPDRDVIKPGENQEKEDFKIEALELADMPSRYTLIFNHGVAMEIRPPSDGFFSGIANIIGSFIRFILRPFPMLWYAVTGKPYTVIDLVLDRDDARALYWSISEGANAIIYPVP